MVSCHDMKEGQIYTCEDCGLELKVLKECKECGTSAEECGCSDETDHCEFSCCGEPLKLKK
ncbi:MAG: hypothetical protein ACFFDI_03680 [Promethearchaeota archaeon]